MRRCFDNYDWSAHKGQCVPRPSESCSLMAPLPSCQGVADGLYHAAGGCGRYLQCRGDRKTERACAGRQEEFDAHLQRCRGGRSRTCVRPLAAHLRTSDIQR